MQLTVIHRNADSKIFNKPSFLDFSFTNPSLSEIIIDEFENRTDFYPNESSLLAIPDNFRTVQLENKKIIFHDGQITLSAKLKPDQWLIISNGRYITRFDCKMLAGTLENYNHSLVIIDVDPGLRSYREKIQTISFGHVAGVRRLYFDSIIPYAPPENWPMHLLIKFGDFQRIFLDQLPESFSLFKNRCQLNSLKINSFKIAGNIKKKKKEDHVVDFLSRKMNSKKPFSICFNIICGRNCNIAKTARIIGQVRLGNNTHIEENAVLIGPVIIGDNVTVSNSAIIKSSVIADHYTVPEKSVIENRILDKNIGCIHNDKIQLLADENISENSFRQWPRLSYVNTFKRLADLFVSSMVLLFFAPIFPIIALVIKLTSKGPVFFKHKRQGLHGKEFDCLKFRTMITGADEIQAKLKSKNQVDGPQFKVEDDPRITVVGKFLRNTFIDEIPQFVNVLLGQMSLVGPRPSPKKENSSCPLWRDARLSVRPGITGIWQVCRTRQQGRDFQEWIFYDTQYVKNLSLKMDLKICFKTVKKLAIDFVKQF